MATMRKKMQVSRKHVPVKALESPDEEDAAVPVIPVKAKRPIELDIVDAALGIEEKTDPEAPVPEEGAEETGDELSIDDEELDPFGDKWEQ